jgi:hypothetical protein
VHIEKKKHLLLISGVDSQKCDFVLIQVKHFVLNLVLIQTEILYQWFPFYKDNFVLMVPC